MFPLALEGMQANLMIDTSTYGNLSRFVGRGVCIPFIRYRSAFKFAYALSALEGQTERGTVSLDRWKLGRAVEDRSVRAGAYRRRRRVGRQDVFVLAPRCAR